MNRLGRLTEITTERQAAGFREVAGNFPTQTARSFTCTFRATLVAIEKMWVGTLTHCSVAVLHDVQVFVPGRKPEKMADECLVEIGQSKAFCVLSDGMNRKNWPVLPVLIEFKAEVARGTVPQREHGIYVTDFVFDALSIRDLRVIDQVAPEASQS